MSSAAERFAPKPALEYPFGYKWSPEPGQPFEVMPGVFWLRMPLPISLDHINLWLLKDGDGWAIVDCGYDDEGCKSVWQQVFNGFLNPHDVTRIFVTHFHPDHIGLAAWLSAQCDAPVLMSRGEYRRYRSILKRDDDELADQARDYLTELNYPAEFHERLIAFFKADEKPEESRVNQSMVEFIQEGDRFEINGLEWRVIGGNGHSPEHCCFYNETLNGFISGDQIIPRISSNVSVYLANRDDDPLGDWIASCEKLRDALPADTLILPSHQEPFVGVTDRMQQLIHDHHAQLSFLQGVLKTRALPVNEVRQCLFDRELNPVDMVLATGETQAHLNYLLHRALVEKHLNDQGVAHYSLPRIK